MSGAGANDLGVRGVKGWCCCRVEEADGGGVVGWGGAEDETWRLGG